MSGAIEYSRRQVEILDIAAYFDAEVFIVGNKEQALMIPGAGEAEVSSARVCRMIVDAPAVIGKEQSPFDKPSRRRAGKSVHFGTVINPAIQSVVRSVDDILFEIEGKFLREFYSAVKCSRHRLKGGGLGLLVPNELRAVIAADGDIIVQ